MVTKFGKKTINATTLPLYMVVKSQFAPKPCTFATMRPVAFILAIIVLALSCMPCTDGANAMGKRKATNDLAKSSNRQNNRDQSDSCSPFCQCACCAGFPINHTIANIQVVISDYIKEYSNFPDSTLISISFPIWQPPQL